MATGIWTAASAAVGQMTALDVSTNNLVNSSTPGFRADAVVFHQAYVRALGPNTSGNSLRPVVVRTVAPNLMAGPVITTGRSLDVAIADNQGLFAVSTLGGVRYTRAGNFQLRVDGTLTTSDGLPVLTTKHRPVAIDPRAANVEINRDGAVVVDGVQGPTIAVVRFANPARLEKTDGVLLQAPPEAGSPIPYEPDLQTQALELSHKSSINGIANQINTARDFDMASRVVEAFATIERTAANDIMKRT